MQQVTTRLAEMWKGVDTRELDQCKLEAELCKDEYKKLKEAYVPPVYATKGKHGKKGRELNGGKPKRPRTAYLLFAEDCRARLKKSSPDLSFTEVRVSHLTRFASLITALYGVQSESTTHSVYPFQSLKHDTRD
jgi:hypothetical protein